MNIWVDQYKISMQKYGKGYKSIQKKPKTSNYKLDAKYHNNSKNKINAKHKKYVRIWEHFMKNFVE